MFHNFGVEHELYLGTDNIPSVKIKAIRITLLYSIIRSHLYYFIQYSLT